MGTIQTVTNHQVMTMMEIIKDTDLYDHFSEYDVTLIGTNIYASMGHGIQLKVMMNYPFVYDMNMATKYGDMRKMGTILECKKDGEPLFCLCFITKGYNFRPDLQKDYLSYEALEKCLKLANVKYKGKRICCTLMGTSKFDGNGDRDRVLELYEDCLKDCDVTIYDYVQKHRDKEYMEMFVNEKKVKDVDPKKYYEMVRKRKKEAEERYRKNGHRRW